LFRHPPAQETPFLPVYFPSPLSSLIELDVMNYNGRLSFTSSPHKKPSLNDWRRPGLPCLLLSTCVGRRK
jgi:hypothetical protein